MSKKIKKYVMFQKKIYNTDIMREWHMFLSNKTKNRSEEFETSDYIADFITPGDSVEIQGKGRIYVVDETHVEMIQKALKNEEILNQKIFVALWKKRDNDTLKRYVI